MYGKKRTYGSRMSARARSQPPKKAKVVTVKTPRWRALKNPHDYSIANSFRTKLTYFENFTINPGAGINSVYVFSANGLYDPNISGVGHQPVGFDQIMALYGEFVVVGSTIKVWASHTQDNTAAPPFICGVFLLRLATADTDLRKYVENGNGVYTVVNTKDSDSVKKLEYNCDMNKEIGHSVIEDEGVAGTATANPPEQRFYHVTCQPFDYTTDMNAMQFTAEITFDVIFRDRVLTDIS